MAVKLKKVIRKNPITQTEKWYLTQETQGSVGIEAIARAIERNTALTYPDVTAVLLGLVQVLPEFLFLGQSIKLDKFGSFRVSVSSEGLDSPEALTHRNVRGAKLVFTPGVELKNSLKSLSFTVTS